jgi:hypothetical protein
VYQEPPRGFFMSASVGALSGGVHLCPVELMHFGSTFWAMR